MIEHTAVLRDDVRFVGVGGDGEVPEDRTGVDAAIDAQQRDADIRPISPRARPEAAVRVAILRADAGMQHEGAERRDREDRFFEERLAACDRQLRRAGADERFGVRCIRRRDEKRWRIRRSRKSPSEILQIAHFPCVVRFRARQAIPDAKGQHIQEPPRADALHLTRDSPAEPRPALTDHEHTRNGRPGSEPADQSLAVERRVLMADEQRPHRYQQIPR